MMHAVFKLGQLTYLIDIKKVFMLDYPGLQALAAVVREGSFERAARALHVTPSAVSQRVKLLEERLGRVLVVRGSLNQPEAFIVDTMAVTAGRLPDFKLQPRDIVYVSHRPFYRVEDLLDLATTAFIQAVVTSWVGEDIVEP